MPLAMPHAQAAEMMGLISGHAYSLLGVTVLERGAGYYAEPVRLLQLRNPWGKNHTRRHT